MMNSKHSEIFPSELAPVIIFEDPNLLVLSKPAGLLSQGEEKGDPNLVDWLRNYFGRQYVGLIHRLDRNTSGIMVVAKRTKAAKRLTQALQNGEIIRSYHAWVIGNLSKPARWQHWLLKDEKKNEVKVVSKTNPKAKEALLFASPKSYSLYEDSKVTLVQFELETGRSHQIRVQAAAEGFPILGDKKYGNSKRLKSSKTFQRPALHSFQITFPHPISGEILSFQADLPKDMRLSKSRE